MVKLIEFEEEVDVSPDLVDDMKTIMGGDVPKMESVDDLKGSPFIQEPARKKAFKPPPPQPQEKIEEFVEHVEQQVKVKPIKPKKQLSEKQKAHLEKMRLKKMEKAKAKVEKIQDKIDITKSVTQTIEEPPQPSEQELMDMEGKEFDKWLKYMDKFEKMLQAVKKEEARKQADIMKKEKEIEDRIRKKIELENQQRQGIQMKVQETPQATMLQKPTEDYGEFANYFGY